VRPTSFPAERVPLVLYDDPLSPWCLIAERRITAALEDLPGVFAPLRHAPFPGRVDPYPLTRAELRAYARVARRAAREPEGAGTCPDLWLSPDPPLSSVPALAALAAARLQGAAHEEALRQAVRQAALFRGVNVARTDVLLELAERAGLDLARFAAAFQARRSADRVRESLEEAVEKGIECAPALVVGEEWLVSGPRSADEYRALLRRYAIVRLGHPSERTLH
jgi:predicted DsbA family dithiol-disulfide isomerase